MEEDLELSLLSLFKNNWNLTGDLHKDKIFFHRKMRKIEEVLTQPNIIIRESVDVNAWDKQGMAECLASIVVRTAIQALGTADQEVEATKQLKKSIRSEVYRILREATLPSGWEWAHITRRINADNFDTIQPALLGEDLYVTIAYQRSG